jgi:hypothetical protein
MPKRHTSRELARRLQEKGLPVTFTPRDEPKRSNQESIDQQALIEWWAANCVHYGLPARALKAFPLQGARTPQNGARMKKEGMRAGTCDLFLSTARAGFHGLWIEMKTADGVISPEQLEELAHLAKEDYSTAVCRSTDEAIAEIEIYLGPT